MSDSLKKRYLIKLMANIVTGLINAILIAIVPKALGPVSYGYFTFLQYFFNQVISLLDASTSIGFFTKLSARNDRKELIKFYLGFSIILLLVMLAVLYVVKKIGYTEFFLSEIPDEYIYLGFWFSFLTWFTQVYIKISDAYALTVSVELIKIAHKLILLGILLYIINYVPFDLFYYYYFQFLSLLSFVFVISYVFFGKAVVDLSVLTVKIRYKEIIIEFYKFCSPLFLFNITAIGIGILDIWLLQKTSGSTETGFYGLAYSIAAMCFLFTSAMTPVITREFSKSFAERNLLEVSKLFKRYVPMLYAMAAYLSVFVVFKAEDLLIIFTDERFKDAYFALIILAFYPLHQTYGQINSALYFATEDTVRYRNIGFISALLGLLLSYIFIYKLEYGAAGFAWKIVITQLFSVNLQLFFNVKKLGLNFYRFLYHQIYTVICFAVIAYISSSIIDLDSSIESNFLVTGIVYSVSVLLFVYLFPSVIGLSKQKLSTILSGFIKR